MEGKKLSAYKIVSELGSGGMGKVYRAQVTAKAAGLEPGTDVALKVIHAHLLETPGFFKRFMREAQVGQQVEHANVVRTYDCDATLLEGQQQNFLVMEYVEGQTLRGLQRELRRVPEELCRHIGHEVASGLAAIHDAGVVHRDVKPENVLITEAHIVKVMDLGVARLQEEAIRLSQTGTFVGSLEYAAPEQFQSGEPADHRADLHALGVMLYELATGQHPYRDDDLRRMIRKILDESPRRAGDLNPQLSPFFEEVVHTLLAKERSERFDSAEALAEVLREGESSAWWNAHAKALRSETRQPLRRMRVPRETALYGREADLITLRRLFDKASTGHGQVVLIEGEAGIGKTRLVDEFVGLLRQDGEDVNFLFGSYPPGGAATVSGAFSTAYREQFGDADLDETLKDYLTPTPVLVPSFAALLRGESTPSGAEPLTKDSLQTVFVHATRALAAERPTIVLIDDLHFSPEDGRALFASVAAAIPGHRVLLVGTTRPGAGESWVANLERLGHTSRLVLSRLGPKDLLRLLEDSFRSERLAHELAGQVAIKSDGNPFFAFEIIRGLREGQFITQSPDGSWVSTQVIKDIQIPSSIMDLIQARLRDLGDEEKDLLDVASCCGFRFDPSVLAAVAEVPLIPTLKSLARIEAKHRLIRSAGMGFDFDHHQVQESLYEALPGMLRREYHAAIARVFETRTEAEGANGVLAVEICEHSLKGGRGAGALAHLDAALDHLQAGYLLDQMAALAGRALDVPELLQGRERVALQLRMNDALQTLGRRDAQATLLDETAGLMETLDDDALRARVRSARGALFARTARYDESLAECEAALELAGRARDREQEAEAHRGIGLALTHLARYEDAASHLERSLAISRKIGAQEQEGQVAGTLGILYWRQGRNEEALEQEGRAIELARLVGNRRNEAAAVGCVGLIYMAQGRNDEARVESERALATFREIGDRPGEVAESGNVAITYLGGGLLADALDRFRRAYAMSGELGMARDEAINLHNEGQVLAYLGAPEEAQACRRTALEIARTIGYRFLEALATMELAGHDAELGNPDKADALYLEALRHNEAIGARDQHAGEAHLRYGAFLAGTGRADEARPHLEEALAIGQAADSSGLHVLSLLELALLDDGDPAAAVAAFEEGETLIGHGDRIDARYMLYQVTGDEQHLDAAYELLAFFHDHAPDEYKDSTLTGMRLHREVAAAWERDSTDS